TREAILSALIKLSKELKEDDNLLIYYAGHGSIHSNRGHWLPQDAKSKEYDASWISSDDIRKEIETTTMKAKHVLIVSDSCYSASVITAAITAAPMTTAAISSPVATRSTSSWTGLASASSVVIPDLAGSSPEARVAYIKALSERLSRRALTSGGFEPVLDVDSGNGLSIFANAFLEALAKNDDVIDTNRIFLNIREEVSVKAKERGGNQVPVYARIEHTGDNNGEFFFMPIAGQRNR
ncbi:MAG: caspase family protein, partial [Gammaproteobacteria bacterium]